MRVLKLVTVLFILIVICFFLYFILVKTNNDAKHFKTEYEKLNGLKDKNKKKYIEVKIPKDNNVKYASFDKVMEFLDNGTGILYLGFPECPWCRNMVPILIDTAMENEIENSYYFNALSIRDIKKLDDDGNIITTKKGTKDYYKLVDKLKDFLGPYEGLGDDSIKRIYFPTVIFLQGGKIVGSHIGTVDSQKDPYKVLNKSQKKELKQIFVDNINKIYGVCDKNC